MSRALRVLLSVFSGILLSLGWLGFPGWILFFAFLPLFYLEHFFTENKNNFLSITFWGYSFLTFIVWNSLTSWWIAHATIVGAVMAIFVNSFLMSLVFWLAHFARRKLKPNLGYLALAVFWVSFEYFHFRWDIEWPWLTLGNGFANNVKLIQWYEFTGVLGGSLWVLWVNIILFQFILKFKNAIREKCVMLRKGFEIIMLIFIPILFSWHIYSHYIEKGESKNIVLVQPNVDPYLENFSLEAENEKIRNYIELAKTGINDTTDFVLGPETVVENYLVWNENRFDENLQLEMFQNFLSEYPNTELIFGASTSKIYPDKNHATETAREKNGTIYDVFNSAIFLNNSGEVQVYHKSILVSGVEKVPFVKYFGFLKNMYFDLGGASGNLGSQNESLVFVSRDGSKIAPVICYESVFGEYLTGHIQKGAGLIFVITNDAWWKNSPGYKQHFSFSRLRAIETRRGIARAANTGISGFINQKGDVLYATKWNEKTTLVGTLISNNKITFYVKSGDYIARISLFMSALLLLFLISELLRKGIKKPH